jgi:hypothetical protein
MPPLTGVSGSTMMEGDNSSYQDCSDWAAFEAVIDETSSASRTRARRLCAPSGTASPFEPSRPASEDQVQLFAGSDVGKDLVGD